ncbi:hypothetical protein ACR4XJ_08180 [Nitratidesulfovibrio sp. D1]
MTIIAAQHSKVGNSLPRRGISRTARQSGKAGFSAPDNNTVCILPIAA